MLALEANLLSGFRNAFILKLSFLTGYPVSRSEQEVLGSQPVVSQQSGRLRPPPCKPRLRYLSRGPQGLLVPPSSLLHSTRTLHPLHADSRLQRTVVWSGSVQRPSSTAGEHLSAPRPLPHPAGPYSGAPPAAGVSSEQHHAEVSQQPRGTQLEDDVGLGMWAGLNHAHLKGSEEELLMDWKKN